MNKFKIVLGMFIVMVLSVGGTLAAVCYLLGIEAANATNVVRFFTAVKFVQQRFVNEVSSEKLMNGAIAGMMGSLDDPHSVYLDKKMYTELKSHTEGSFGGIGVVMGMKNKEVTVVSPIEGTPGAEAGIKTGDQIVKIDGIDTKEITLEEAANKIRGEAGTKVVLMIRREGETDKEYEIMRSNIEIKTVGSTLLEDSIGYIRITTFSEHTGADTIKAYEELTAKGAKAIVLDLRNNPGGLLSASVDVSNLFVPAGKVVSIIKRDGTKEEYMSNLAAVKYPLAVLINGGSASASEIVAGAVQDTGAGTVIGTKSYGKGSVQVVVPMYGGDALKMTIAKYYTPQERCIDGVGIMPDIEVALDGQVDNQLQKAIEVLKGKI